ncbi:MAG: hypothetical protein M1817_005617 [Caeruleum heppii]|nr:MAG: hypothetical protein M1817_005617 [Caeruleum heppii]
MDPLSISASVATLFVICLQITRLLKCTIEVLRGAKDFLFDLLREISHMQAVLKRLETLTRLMRSDQVSFLVDVFDIGRCQETIEEVRDIVQKIEPMTAGGQTVKRDKVWASVKWVSQRSGAQKLIERLQRDKLEIMGALQIIGTESILFSERKGDEKPPAYVEMDRADLLLKRLSDLNILEMNERQRTKEAHIANEGLPLEPRPVLTPTGNVDSGPGLSSSALPTPENTILVTSETFVTAVKPTQSEASALPDSSSRKQEAKDRHKIESLVLGAEPILAFSADVSSSPLWYSIVEYETTESTNPYVAFRRDLAYNAYNGRWEELIGTLDLATRMFGENWVNCSRLQAPFEGHTAPGWTPLHQVAFIGASPSVAQKLIDLGAWRTLRTLRTNPAERPHQNMSPLEIARTLGHSWLFDVLAPRILHHVPASTLVALQTRFHDLIKATLGEFTLRRLRLPELEVLTELKKAGMWFEGRGYLVAGRQTFHYRLDNRELVVQVRPEEDDASKARLYRITETTTEEIEEAVVWDV